MCNRYCCCCACSWGFIFIRKQRLLKRTTDELRVHVKCKPDLASLELASDVRTYDFKRVSPVFDKAAKDRN